MTVTHKIMVPSHVASCGGGNEQDGGGDGVGDVAQSRWGLLQYRKEFVAVRRRIVAL